MTEPTEQDLKALVRRQQIRIKDLADRVHNLRVGIMSVRSRLTAEDINLRQEPVGYSLTMIRGAYERLILLATREINDYLAAYPEAIEAKDAHHTPEPEPSDHRDGPITATIDYEDQAVNAMADGNMPAAQVLALLQLARTLEYGLAKPAARSSQLPTRYAGPAHPENVAG